MESCADFHSLIVSAYAGRDVCVRSKAGPSTRSKRQFRLPRPRFARPQPPSCSARCRICTSFDVVRRQGWRVGGPHRMRINPCRRHERRVRDKESRARPGATLLLPLMFPPPLPLFDYYPLHRAPPPATTKPPPFITCANHKRSDEPNSSRARLTLVQGLPITSWTCRLFVIRARTLLCP